VVVRVVDLLAGVEQALHGAAELLPIGVDQRHVVQPCVTRRRRAGALALERVQRDVVVVVARRHEGGREQLARALEPPGRERTLGFGASAPGKAVRTPKSIYGVDS
jgi:hypothetical protein